MKCRCKEYRDAGCDDLIPCEKCFHKQAVEKAVLKERKRCLAIACRTDSQPAMSKPKRRTIKNPTLYVWDEQAKKYVTEVYKGEVSFVCGEVRSNWKEIVRRKKP